MESVDQLADIRAILSGVTDPEIPVLTIEDLGIVRDIELHGKEVLITITPTYSGCPAMDTISDDIRLALLNAGYQPTIKSVLSPAWSSLWISEAGRQKMEQYGIAPPLNATSDKKSPLAWRTYCKVHPLRLYQYQNDQPVWLDRLQGTFSMLRLSGAF